MLKCALECTKLRHFFSKKIQGGGGGGAIPDPLAWLSAFCARRKILHVSNMMKLFVFCDMLKGKREARIISYKYISCQVKAFNGNLYIVSETANGDLIFLS